jgi:hypothetical protein
LNFSLQLRVLLLLPLLLVVASHAGCVTTTSLFNSWHIPDLVISSSSSAAAKVEELVKEELSVEKIRHGVSK